MLEADGTCRLLDEFLITLMKLRLSLAKAYRFEFGFSEVDTFDEYKTSMSHSMARCRQDS